MPNRGTAVVLSDTEFLLCVTGSTEMKREDDGTPSPILIWLDKNSTFRDIVYLAEQIFAFSHW